jgi:hypothetical protein
VNRESAYVIAAHFDLAGMQARAQRKPRRAHRSAGTVEGRQHAVARALDPSSTMLLDRLPHDTVDRNGGRRRKTTIAALARKLLVALWKYVNRRRRDRRRQD